MNKLCFNKFIVVQDKEVIRINLNEYFEGSFLQFNLKLNYNDQLNIPFNKIFDIPKNYELIGSENYKMGRHVDSLSDTMKLIITDVDGVMIIILI